MAFRAVGLPTASRMTRIAIGFRRIEMALVSDRRCEVASQARRSSR